MNDVSAPLPASPRVRVPRHGQPAERFVDQLLAWLEAAGATRYDESVTQFEHALQSAQLAADRGFDDALVIACLLHDVGHLLADEHDGHGDFLARDLHHEQLGARWLARAFGPEVTGPIELHVDAKRYLCTCDASYRERLSDSSKRSLKVQGGLMSADEAAAFAEQVHAEAAMQLRRIDDEAKLGGAAVAPAASYRTRLVRAVERSKAP